MKELAGDLWQMRRMLFRPVKSPTVTIPFGVRSCGFYGLAAGWHEFSQARDFAELFWCVRGELEFINQRKSTVVHPDEVYFYKPQEEQSIQALQKSEYYWLTIDGEMASSIFSSFGLKRHQVAGACPVRLFQKLEQIMYNTSAYGQRTAASLAFRIMAEACGNRPERGTQEESFADRCASIIHDNISSQDFTIEKLARMMNIHRSSLTKKFASVHKTSPLAFLNAVRVQKALYLLKESSMQIKEISARCGFCDPDYFCKVIKKNTGLSPSTFRRKS